MEKNKMVLASEIYEEIEAEIDSTSRDSESLKRLLRNKFTFLMKNVLLRAEAKYKSGNKNYVLCTERHIVKEFLKASLEETSEIGKWFNLKLNLSSADQTLELFNIVSIILTSALDEDKVDEVTFDEWIGTIKSSIDYNNAKSVIDVKNKLDKLRVAAKPLNHEIGFGDIYWSDEEGNRGYGLKNSKNILSDFDTLTLKEIAQQVHVESEYYEILQYLISKFEEQAHQKSYETILNFAEMKREYESIFDIKGSSKISDFAAFTSDYSQMHLMLYEYLLENPEICKKIEAEAKTSELLEFFKYEK
ncbi:hypothetical protein LKL90_26415 [Bacillus mobilis]|uniref:hypothetical protein n=1 Tax=Bacillus mobilis TaxID=2026190 RepID=UPI001E4BB966|nr:hypothetical protein [Bacillus mobilis]MCC2463899.1 hypothetical protein [Bacillus mobilis]MCU5436699.1 hypothetical protein [Bacillus mobilis]